MNELGPIVASVLGVFLVMGVGAACRSTGWLTTEADRTLANLTANVMLPAYFVDKFTQGDQIESIASAWLPPVVGFTATACGFAVALLFAKTIGPRFGLRSDGSQRAFALCAGICNYGYIPLPLAEKFYESSVIDLILHNVGVDLALWSIGIAIIGGAGGKSWKRPLRSPPLWAVLFSIVISGLGLIDRVPESVSAPVLAAIGKLGACAIPLGLLLSGAIIVDFIRDRSWFAEPGVIIAAIGIRQAVLPIMLLGIAGPLIVDSDLRTVIMLQAAMPAAVFPIVLTKLYNRDTETALRVVLWTSLFGLVAIPIWLAIGSWWLGVES